MHEVRNETNPIILVCFKRQVIFYSLISLYGGVHEYHSEMIWCITWHNEKKQVQNSCSYSARTRCYASYMAH